MQARGVAAGMTAALGALLVGCLLTIDGSKVPSDAGVGDAPAFDAPTVDGALDGATEGALDGTVPLPDATALADAGDAPPPGDAAGEGDAPSPSCPASMRVVPAPDGGSYCVDATEVTNDAYASFVAAVGTPDAGSQIPACGWNTTFVPGIAGGAGDAPVGSIDWCDAYGYCQWAGKRLCAAIGGGLLPFIETPAQLATSEWFNACSRGGAQAYPYGAVFDPASCNGAQSGAGQAVAVGSFAGCEGGYPGLFDLSGNAAELIDSCTTTPDPGCDASGPECDVCMLAGGSFLTGEGDGGRLACGYLNQIYRGRQYVDSGFRCCASLQ